MCFRLQVQRLFLLVEGSTVCDACRKALLCWLLRESHHVRRLLWLCCCSKELTCGGGGVHDRPTCAHCELIIRGDYAKEIDKFWFVPSLCCVCTPTLSDCSLFFLFLSRHIDHFVCGQCAAPFDDGVYFEHKGHPFCTGCYALQVRIPSCSFVLRLLMVC